MRDRHSHTLRLTLGACSIIVFAFGCLLTSVGSVASALCFLVGMAGAYTAVFAEDI